MDFGKTRPFCNSETSIFYDSRKSGGFSEFRYINPIYTAKYIERLGDKDYCSDRAMKYHSHLQDNEFIYMCKFKTLNMNRIFSVNIETNDLFGDIDNACNVIWKNNLTLSVRCVNEWCVGSGNVYSYISSPITVERNNSKLSPIVFDAIMLTCPMKDKRISLFNSIESEQTHLMGRKIDPYGNITNIKIIASIPRIPIHDLKNKLEIEKKMKTLLLFS